MSKPVDRVLSRAMQYAATNRHEYLTVEHVLWSLLQEKEIASLLLQPALLKDDLTMYLNGEGSLEVPVSYTYTEPRRTSELTRVFQRAVAQTALSKIPEPTLECILISIMDEVDSHAAFLLEKHGTDRNKLVEQIKSKTSSDGSNNGTPDSALDEFCRNLNDDGKTGSIDPVIGREAEIAHTIEVLAQRKKNNVILVGDPGVGKTAIAEGLARMIVNKEVPDAIADKVVYSMDIGSMVAGTKFRGDFEERIKNVLKDVVKRGNVILFIDEIHMLMGAGAGTGGGVDASNMLKPLLAKGKLMCVGATTYEEFAQHIEKDRALMRRFQKMDVAEPTPDVAKKILAGVAKYYTKFHNVDYDDGVLDNAVDLSVRYLRSKHLPDKAIDLIDAAAACVKLAGGSLVTNDDIIKAVSRTAKIKTDMINTSENEAIAVLDTRLKDKVYGQDEAINAIVESVQLAKVGIRDEHKPIGNFLFVGPTGTGKTHICKELASVIGSKLVRFDMSEYQEKHSVAKFIGAPPGYVGHGEGKTGDGLLISEVENNPNCVLLLDEIEKAAPEVAQILLQVMDDGRLTSSKGKTVDFSNVILVMTSNLGAKDADKRGIGVGSSDFQEGAIDKALTDFFPPEFRNRVDSIIRFNKLAQENMGKIVDAEIMSLDAKLANKNISVVLSNSARIWLSEQGYDPKMGARPLKRLIEHEVKKPIAKMILAGEITDGGIISVGYTASKVTFKVKRIKAEVTSTK